MSCTIFQKTDKGLSPPTKIKFYHKLFSNFKDKKCGQTDECDLCYMLSLHELCEECIKIMTIFWTEQ